MTPFIVVTVVALAVVGVCVSWNGWAGYSEAPFFVGLCAGTVALIAGICVPVYWGSENSCEQRADALGRDWRYGMIAGCLVSTDHGQMVPLDNLRFNENGEVIPS